MVRIDSEALWVFRPGLTDHLEGCAPSQGLEVSGEALGHHKDQHVRFQRCEVGIVEDLDRGLFDRPVHALDLAVGPGMVDLGQTVLDAVFVADAIKNVPTEAIGRAAAIPRLLSERYTVVSEDCVDLIRKRLHCLT